MARLFLCTGHTADVLPEIAGTGARATYSAGLVHHNFPPRIVCYSLTPQYRQMQMQTAHHKPGKDDRCTRLVD